MTKEELIGYMREARETHWEWARYQESLRRRKLPLIENVGNEKHHRKWMRIYDHVIAELEKD